MTTLTLRQPATMLVNVNKLDHPFVDLQNSQTLRFELAENIAFVVVFDSMQTADLEKLKFLAVAALGLVLNPDEECADFMPLGIIAEAVLSVLAVNSGTHGIEIKIHPDSWTSGFNSDKHECDSCRPKAEPAH